MLIHELKKSTGRTPKAQKVWRGNSCRKWNYCGRGMKGQKSRSGGNIPARFEWGQTPLHMRLPKLRWFKRYFKLIDTYEVVNTWVLCDDDRISTTTLITKTVLTELWHISKDDVMVKVLWKWWCSKWLQFVGLDKISNSALTSLEAAWGSFVNE